MRLLRVADPSIGLRWSLRTKLVIVCIVVQVIMLGISFGNSLRLLNDTLERETQARVNELSPLLNAAFSNRLFERDHATIMEVMDQLLGSTSSGLRYIVIYDDQSTCLLYTSPSPRDRTRSRMPSSA